MGCVAYKLNINHRQSSIIAGENIQKFGLTRRVISLYPATYRAFYVRICTEVRRTGDAQRLEMFQDNIIPSMETPRYRARYLLRLSSMKRVSSKLQRRHFVTVLLIRPLNDKI